MPVLALAACMVAVLDVESRAQFHSDEGANFHNTTFIRVDEKAREYLLEAELARDRGDKEKAAAALRRLLLLETDSLLPQNDRVFRPAHELAALRLQELGEAALAPYRKLAAEPARAALKAALAELSPERLRAVVANFPLLPERLEALEALGDLAFESGRLQTAAYYYDTLLRQLDLDPARAASIRAKSLLCDGSSSVDAPARAGQVRLAGRMIELNEVAAVAASSGETAGASNLLAGNERSGIVPHVPRSLRLIASGPLAIEPMSDQSREWVQQQFQGQPENEPLPPSPVIEGGRAFFAGAEALVTIDLASGQQLRPPLLYRDEFGFADNARVHRGSQAICVERGTLYLTLNTDSSLLGSAGKRGFIAAYDVRDGHRLWSVSCHAIPGLPEDLQGFAVSGPPVIIDGRVFVSAARLKGSDTEAYVLGFDARTGAIAWARFLCSAAHVPRYAERFSGARPELVLSAPLSAEHGVMYDATNLGVLAAVAADTGEILWQFKYNRINPQDPGLYQHNNFYDRGPWPSSPLMVAYDRLHVAPFDSRYAYVLDRFPSEAGYLMLGDPIERDVLDRLIAVRANRLLFMAEVGRSYRLVETDLAGTPRTVTPSFKPEENLAGYPLGSDDTLLLPTNRHLYWIAIAPGGLAIASVSPERLLLPEDHPGSLAIAPPYVVSQTASSYDVFREE